MWYLTNCNSNNPYEKVLVDNLVYTLFQCHDLSKYKGLTISHQMKIQRTIALFKDWVSFVVYNVFII